MASISGSPARSAAEHQGRLQGLGQEPAFTQGRRCSGVACTADSLTIARGRPSWSTTTRAPAPASGRPAAAPRPAASRPVTGIALRARAAGVHLRDPGAHAGDAQRLGGADPDEGGQQQRPDAGRGQLRRPARSQRHGEGDRDEQHGQHPAPPGGGDVPEPGLRLSFHTPARSIRPPSSGSPGSRLKTPTIGWRPRAARSARRGRCRRR